MTTKSTKPVAQDASDIQAVAELILQREDARKSRAAKRAKARARRRRHEERHAIEKTHRSIEVIKWCVVAICVVWLISFIISIAVLVRVQSKITEIEGQVQQIRQAIDNPFATAGERLGGQIDDRLKEFLRSPAASDSDP